LLSRAGIILDPHKTKHTAANQYQVLIDYEMWS
jgi:hypothetical protein